MSRSMHIAKSGKQSGRWVTCPAEKKCRIGGTHTTATALQAAKKFAGVSKIEDLTQEHYVDYLKSMLSGNTKPVAPTNTVQPAPRQRRVSSYDSFNQETPDERTERLAREDNEDGKVTFERDFVINSRLRWKAFLNTAMSMDVHIDHKTIGEAGKFFYDGGRNFEFKKEQIRIPEEKVQEFKIRTENYIK